MHQTLTLLVLFAAAVVAGTPTCKVNGFDLTKLRRDPWDPYTLVVNDANVFINLCNPLEFQGDKMNAALMSSVSKPSVFLGLYETQHLSMSDKVINFTYTEGSTCAKDFTKKYSTTVLAECSDGDDELIPISVDTCAIQFRLKSKRACVGLSSTAIAMISVFTILGVIILCVIIASAAFLTWFFARRCFAKRQFNEIEQ